MRVQLKSIRGTLATALEKKLRALRVHFLKFCQFQNNNLRTKDKSSPEALTIRVTGHQDPHPLLVVEEVPLQHDLLLLLLLEDGEEGGEVGVHVGGDGDQLVAGRRG